MINAASNEVTLSYVIWSQQNNSEAKRSIYLDKNFVPVVQRKAKYELVFIYKNGGRKISCITFEDLSSSKSNKTVVDGKVLDHFINLKKLSDKEFNNKRVRLVDEGIDNLSALKRYMVECRRYI